MKPSLRLFVITTLLAGLIGLEVGRARPASASTTGGPHLVLTPTRVPTRTRTPTRTPTRTAVLPSLTPTRASSPCATAVYTIFGRVYDAANPSQGISGATVQTVTMIGAAPSTTTGPDGSYTLPINNPYHGCSVIGLSVWAPGFRQLNVSVTFQALMAQPNRDFALVR